MKIFTAEQMRALDRLTVERAGLPYAILMETAGRRVVEAIIQHYGSIKEKYCAAFCGKGNNGGDGAVVARLLWLEKPFKVDVFLFGRIAETTGAARQNFEIIKQMAADEERSSDRPRLTFQEIETDEAASKIKHLPYYDLVVDALLGTGLTRPAEGLYAAAIEQLNDLPGLDEDKIVAIDLPSGLSSDSSDFIGPHVKADLTIAFTGPKPANVLPPACTANGELVIAGIGTPESLFDQVKPTLTLLNEEWIGYTIEDSRRQPDAHKTSVGDVLLIAGSRGKTGAAALSSEAVLRAGAGLVTVATAQSAQGWLVNQVRAEVMTEALAETEGGAVSHAALERAKQLANKRSVLAVGPGLSSSDESTRRFVNEFVKARQAPIVIDADGLNALAPWPEELRGADELPIIITPHPGEMARLIGRSNAEVVADRIRIAREFATSHHVITVLKGSRSLIAAPDGEVYVNPTGNAGMATAGSGDVLTGLIAGLLAQRPQAALEAAIVGVYLHGLAGDIAASKLGLRSLIASDITAHLSEAILRVGGDAERVDADHSRIQII